MQYLDLEKWGKALCHQSFENLIDNIEIDGLHEVNSEHNPFHFYVNNIHASDWVLVGFTGSVNRKKTNPPYFSFRGISKNIEIGLISISDPTLALDPTIELSWYIGNNVNGNIAQKLAVFLDSFIERKKKKIILCGGSGGGFAALNIHSLMKNSDKAKSFVWNPQTDITEYYSSILRKYYEVGFPDKSANDTTDIRRILELNDHNYRLNEFNHTENLIYINGYDSNHLRKHIRRYILANNKNKVVYIGNWGIGHAPPDKETIETTIKKISNNIEYEKIIKSLSQNSRKPILDFNKDEKTPKESIDLRAIIFENNSNISIILKCNIYDLYTGYQIKFKIISKDKENILTTDYLLGSEYAELYLEANENSIKKLNNAIIEVQIEDYSGKSIYLHFNFNKIRRKRKCKFKI